MKTAKPVVTARRVSVTLLLLLVLAALFWRSFMPGWVHFSNDSPLGMINAEWMHLPAALNGLWYDLNSIGNSSGTFTVSLSAILIWVLGPVGYAKFLAPIALFVVGLGACFFFRQLKLSPLAVTLGALAATLNSAFFSDACWGVASHEIALGMNFFALGLVLANTPETRPLIRWARLALAGLCVGMNVMEAADVGAIYSLFVAAFVFYQSVAEEDGTPAKRLARGVGRVAVVGACAGLIALQTVLSLVGTQIQGIAGTGQDAETKLKQWDFATQWSEPKLETLGLIVPGLFGYKMDTPSGMMPVFQDAYRGGAYWGGMGRTPALDRYFDSGEKGTPPPGGMRFSGGAPYAGILVALIAAWAMAQTFRREKSPFSLAQKKLIWFWMVVMFVSLLLCWGRFAPLFYGTLYQLPYFSTIRNPAKFLAFLSWGLVIVFGYGVHALSRRHLDVVATGRADGPVAQLKNWWTRVAGFDRKWTLACLGILAVSAAAWLVYISQKPALVHFLQARGFEDVATAQMIAGFSIRQAGWGLGLFAVSLGLFTLVIAGYFAGARARWGGLLLGAFLVLDLGRADLPYIVHWDYLQKYEVGTLNPIEKILTDKPYEHRVAKLLPAPLSTPSEFQLFDQLYGIEWTQHHFLYYNIQSLDIIQMPRMPEDLQNYMSTLRIGIKPDAAGNYTLDPTTFPRLVRLWELTDTRYLLGPAGFLNIFNQQFDPGQGRFRIVERFAVNLKPGVTQFHQKLEELTAYPDPQGDYALFDFTGALPRAKLYGNWQVNTNAPAVLNTLADPKFDPAQTVLISTPEKSLPTVATNDNSGTVAFTSYAPQHIVLDVNAPASAVLLLNDKYDPNWRVTVDGRPAELLRCNYIMRGVAVPAGAHTVTFEFRLPSGPVFFTLGMMAAGILLAGLLVFQARKSQTFVVK